MERTYIVKCKLIKFIYINIIFLIQALKIIYCYNFLQVHSIYIEISCPNMPLLDNLKIKIPEFQAFDFYQFDLNEQVEIVSY